MIFRDKISFYQDGKKKAISVRDGFQEYLGIEINRQPFNSNFKIYRSPDTIKKLISKLNMIPVTDGHVDLKEIPQDKILGYIDGSQLIDLINLEHDSTVAVVNDLKLVDNVFDITNNNKELSLGYFADVREHPVYDLEQFDFIPHHLAIVEAGRCGTICKFTDERKEMKKKQDFVDSEEQIPADNVDSKVETKDELPAENIPEDTKEEVADEEIQSTVNIAKISEIIRDLPETIKNMDISELTKLVPVLEMAIENAKSNIPQPDEVSEEIAEGEMEEVMDEEDMSSKEEMKDSKPDFSTFKDSQEFKDAVMKFADQRVGIIMKAKTFLDADYDFSKDCMTIMRDSIATQSNEQFSDEELSPAFKMLSKNENYQNFADSKANEFDKLKEKEI